MGAAGDAEDDPPPTVIVIVFGGAPLEEAAELDDGAAPGTVTVTVTGAAGV